MPDIIIEQSQEVINYINMLKLSCFWSFEEPYGSYDFRHNNLRGKQEYF